MWGVLVRTCLLSITAGIFHYLYASMTSTNIAASEIVLFILGKLPGILKLVIHTFLFLQLFIISILVFYLFFIFYFLLLFSLTPHNLKIIAYNWAFQVITFRLFLLHGNLSMWESCIWLILFCYASSRIMALINLYPHALLIVMWHTFRRWVVKFTAEYSIVIEAFNLVNSFELLVGVLNCCIILGVLSVLNYHCSKLNNDLV